MKSAFTLIELLIVLIVLVILVSFAIPAYTHIMEKALSNEVNNNLTLIIGAEKLYFLENGHYYSSGSNYPEAITNINSNLSLSLPAGPDRKVNYSATEVENRGNPYLNVFAQSIADPAKRWGKASW